MAYTAYTDITFYNNTYHGQPINEADFPRIALRASDEIDKLTFNRIRRTGITSYSTETQESIQLATCVMAECLSIIDGATDNGVVSNSESVGGYSYNIDTNSLKSIKFEAIRNIKQILWQTGLISAVIRT